MEFECECVWLTLVTVAGDGEEGQFGHALGFGWVDGQRVLINVVQVLCADAVGDGQVQHAGGGHPLRQGLGAQPPQPP